MGREEIRIALKFGHSFTSTIPVSRQSKNNIVWSTQNVFWNTVMEGVEGSGILCVTCFAVRAQEKFKVRWLLLPEFPWQERREI